MTTTYRFKLYLSIFVCLSVIRILKKNLYKIPHVHPSILVNISSTNYPFLVIQTKFCYISGSPKRLIRNSVKHLLLILLSILLLSSPVIGKSDEKPCYVSVTSSEDFNQSLLSNISISVISQYLNNVKAFPASGLSGDDNCIYEVTATKDKEKTFVTLQGKNLNSYGDANSSGTDGFQQSLLRSIYRSQRDKRDLICSDYPDILKECGGLIWKSVELVREVIKETKEIIKENFPVAKPKVVSRSVKKENPPPEEVEFKCKNDTNKKESEFNSLQLQYSRGGESVTPTSKDEPNPMGAYKFCDLEETKKEKEEMVRITPFSGKPSFLVKKSSVQVARCRSGCPSSRAATMGYKHEGIYWIKSK
jgi:hypothetical protein